MPGGLALHEGRLYVADFFALRGLNVHTGEEERTVRDVIGFSSQGLVMSVHAMGENLVLTSWFDNAVKIWNPSTESAVMAFRAAAPSDAIGLEGDVVATEYGTGEAVRFSTADPESRSTLASGIDGPAGLATHGGDLYVTENHAGRVPKLSPDGATEVLAKNLADPEGIAIANGPLYVVEAGAGRLPSVDLETGRMLVIAEGLETNVPASGAYPQTMIFNGVAVSGDRAYVSGDRINAIYAMPLYRGPESVDARHDPPGCLRARPCQSYKPQSAGILEKSMPDRLLYVTPVSRSGPQISLSLRTREAVS